MSFTLTTARHLVQSPVVSLQFSWWKYGLAKWTICRFYYFFSVEPCQKLIIQYHFLANFVLTLCFVFFFAFTLGPLRSRNRK